MKYIASVVVYIILSFISGLVVYDTTRENAYASDLLVSGVVSAFLALIPAHIASKKGRSFIPWSFYGWVFFPIALIHSILLKSNENTPGMKKCPFCAEIIKQEAKVCRYCSKELPEKIEAGIVDEYKGIRIGDNSSKLLGVLGNPKKKNNNEWIYQDVTIIIANNTISEIKIS